MENITNNNVIVNTPVFALFPETAPLPWLEPAVPNHVKDKVMYLPIYHNMVNGIAIEECREEMVDLRNVDNPRIVALADHDEYAKKMMFDGHSKVRHGVCDRLLRMLDILPDNVGIAYFEGFRPIKRQKEYFDSKFIFILEHVKDPEVAYNETVKHVSPIIDNVPPHSTGGAIDITLFYQLKDGNISLFDMGKFDTITCHNYQQETFSPNTTMLQRQNRLLMVEAAAKVGLINYGFEWWHYSYGDRAWAYAEGRDSAIYSTAQHDGTFIPESRKQYYASLGVSGY